MSKLRTGETGYATDGEAYFQQYKFEKVLLNINEMLCARDYINITCINNLSKIIDNIFVNEDKYFHTPIITASTKEGKQILIFLSPYAKIGVHTIRDYIEDLNANPNSHGIIFSSLPPNPTAITEIDKQKLALEILSFDDMLSNVTHHKLSPIVIKKLSDEEKDKLMKKLGIQSLQKLPEIQTNDAIVKYYGYKVGDLLKLQYQHNPPEYRVVASNVIV